MPRFTKHKYSAVRTACNAGHSHPSKREAARCDELHLMQLGGLIDALCYEPKFEFYIAGVPLKMQRGIASYKPDFTYRENGKLIAEDIKGMIAKDFPLREALFRHLFPQYELRVIK